MSSIIRWRSGSSVLSIVMGSFLLLSEVHDTSILRTGLPISQLVTDLSALASRAAGCRAATLCVGTTRKTSAVQRFRQLSEGLETRSGRQALSRLCRVG